MFEDLEDILLAEVAYQTEEYNRKYGEVYPFSAFNQPFDRDMFSLVLRYDFDFEAIALHLYYKFPQYAYKLTARAVAYRWNQLTLKPRATGYAEKRKENGVKRWQCEAGEVTMRKMERKKSQVRDKQSYEAALRMAQVLDEEEEDRMFIYMPKFIMDTEFKLEREEASQEKLQAIIDKEVCYQFGQFTTRKIQSIDQHQDRETQYLDDDWEGYESD